MREKESAPVTGREEKPAIAIYRRGLGFSVEIGGVEIERLKSFSVAVNNEFKPGIHEAPSYQVEQYLPTPKKDRPE